MATMNDVWAVYEGAVGHWCGCDWPTRYGSGGLDLDGVTSQQARQSGAGWRTRAGDAGGGDAGAAEEAALVNMALHLRLRRAVVCRDEPSAGPLHVCGQSARRLCAEALAREWEFAAYWLAEIEADARWAEQLAREAVGAAEEGAWGRALGLARRACAVESGYELRRSWKSLEEVIAQAAG